MFFDTENAADDIEQSLRRGRAGRRRPRQRRSTSTARRSTTRTASRAPGSRSTTRTRSAPAAAASPSPDRSRFRPTAPLRRGRCASALPVQRLVRRPTSRSTDGRVAAVGAARAARARLGQGRLRAAGPVRLLHGAGRRRAAGRVRDAGGAGSTGRAVTTVEGLDPTVRDRLASAFVATGGSQCGFCTPGIVMRASRRARAATSIGRSPRTCAGAPVGARSYDAIRRRRAGDRSPTRDLGRGRAARRARRRRSPSASASTCRSAARRSPTTPRRATRSSRCRSRRVRPPTRSKRPGCSGSSARRCSKRATAAGKVQGRRTTVESGRRCSTRCPRARRAACGSRRRGSSPRTSSPTRRGASPAASPRRRSRTAARSAARCTRAHRAPRASSPTASVARCASCTRARTSCGSVRSARRSPRPRCGATARSRSTAWSRGGAAAFARVWPTPYACEVDARLARRSTSPVRPSAPTLRAAGLAEQARARRGRARRRGVDRATLTDDPALLDACVRAPSGASAGARVHIDAATGRSIASRCASRPAIRSTRSCCGRTRSARRTWRWAGCCTEVARRRSRNRRGARPHDPVVRHHARQGHAAGRRRRSSTTTASRSRALVRRGVRRGRGRDVERAHPCRRRAARYVPGASDARRRADSGGSDARRTRFHTECAAGRRRRTRPRCARATGSCSPGQVGLDPDDAARSSTASRRRRARCSPTSRRCSATAARRCTDVAKTTVFVTDIARLRHRERGLRRRRSATTARPLDRAGRRAARRRRGRDRSLGLSPA